MPHPIAFDTSLDVNAKIIETTNPRALKIHQGKAARSAAFFCCSGSNSSRFAQYIQKTIEKSAERKKSIGKIGKEYSSCKFRAIDPPFKKLKMKIKTVLATAKSLGF